MKFIQKIHLFIIQKSYIQFLLVFVFLFSIFSLVYISFPFVTSGDDHFFHIRFAEHMRDVGVIDAFKDFKALYFTKHVQLNEYFIYYNFLFYIVLIPFTYLSPLFLGIKFYGVFSATCAFLLLYFCFKKLNIKYAFLWLIMILGVFNHLLIYRFFFARPYTLAPALLILCLLLAHKNKHKLLCVFSFLYVFWHSATFYFPLLIVFLYSFFCKVYKKRWNNKIVGYSTAGVFLAILSIYLIPSNFFYLMYDIFFKIFSETILGNSVNIPEGIEVYRKDFLTFLGQNQVPIFLWIISVTYFVQKSLRIFKDNVIETLQNKEKNNLIFQSSLFFLSATFFSASFLLSGRFEDFSFFFMAFFIVIIWDEIISSGICAKPTKKVFMTSVIVLSTLFFSSNSLSLYSSFATATNPLTFSNVGRWINNNVPKHSVIFFSNWSWFPQLYYYAPGYRFVTGIEPRFLYDYNPELYWEWRHISVDGYVCKTEICDENIITKLSHVQGEEIAKAIVDHFESRVILITKKDISLKKILDSSKYFELVYQDNDLFFIYKIK